MDLLGKRALFAAGEGAVLLVLALCGTQLYRERRRARPADDRDGPAVRRRAA
jgi:hypothetical protein